MGSPSDPKAMAPDRTGGTGSNDGGPRSDDGRTRRGYLAALGGAGALALAGCSGGGGDGGDGDSDDGDDGGGQPTQPGGVDSPGGGGGGDGGSGCAPDSIAYRTIETSNVEVEGPIATVDVPEEATLNRREYTIDVTVTFGGEQAEFNVEAAVLEDATIQGLVEAGEVDPANEITDRFDLGGADKRAFTLLGGSTDDEVPRNSTVYVPMGSDVLYFAVTAVSTGCRDASGRVYERMVTSVEPA